MQTKSSETLTDGPLIQEPSNPYDTAAWLAFYEANPGFRRSVGAAGVNDGGEGGDAGDEGAADVNNADTGQTPDGGAEPKGDDKSGKPSDKEAELLKDVMKHKEARKAAEAKLKELEQKLNGVDLEEYQALKAEREESERKKAEEEEQRAIERGEFDKVKQQMVEQHTKALEAKDAEIAERDAKLAAAMATIEELTVGSDFSSSKFIAEETIYTPSKARRLYGDHFEVVDGKTVGYDKPRGAEGRSMIVDANGDPAPFEVAMRRIVEADPEKDDILVSSLKPGAQSSPSRGGARAKEAKPATSRDKIADGVKSLMAAVEKPEGIGFKMDPLLKGD